MEKKNRNFSTPKCVLTQILRKVLSYTKDCAVSISKSHEVFCHCVLRSAYCLWFFFPLKVCISLNVLIAAVLLKSPFLISYRKSLNFVYKNCTVLKLRSTVASTLESAFQGQRLVSSSESVKMFWLLVFYHNFI